MNNCHAMTLVLHLVSAHSPSDFDNANYGAGLECRVDSWAVEAGGYRNSYGRGSAYLAGGYWYALDSGWAVGLALGVATNYPEGMVPVGGITLHTPEWEGWGARLMVGPKVHEHGAHVAHLMLTRKL